VSAIIVSPLGSLLGAPRRAVEVAADAWRPLRYFAVYRVVLAGLLVTMAVLDLVPGSARPVDRRWALGLALVYLALALAGGAAVWRRWPPFDLQVRLQTLGDILAIALLMYATGGVRGGLGLLLVVAVGGGSILSSGRMPAFLAAVASVAVLAQEALGPGLAGTPDAAWVRTGVLGVTLFAAALLVHMLAHRVRESEALARQRALDLVDLARLNEHVIQRMQSGVLAAGPDGRVRLANDSARRLLGLPRLDPGTPLETVSPELGALLSDWRADPSTGPRVFHATRAGAEVIASLAAIGPPAAPAALVFLEDMASVTQRAQHLKLASLGRLTASIAHEIRNPLGAISHAAQLLAESPYLPHADQRLTQIITQQSHRLNAVIDNVLQLSRRRDPDLQRFALREWLEGLAAELVRQRGLAPGAIEVRVDPPDLEVRADPSQLHQAVQNLCENGLRHATGRPLLRLTAGTNVEAERPYLEVCDSGPGVPPDLVAHLFEPFFTTERQGTGLGLYLARELCEGNQAVLEHRGMTEQGHCFRITFTHPARRGVATP
jgi:two-component system sensor histidine kinase PilS (NtrC family)